MNGACLFDALETLLALKETGTMTAAATRLRLTQSSVSKRIAVLEARLGRKLVEPIGRKVKLTAFAVGLLERSGPLLGELRQILLGETTLAGGRIVMGVSESVLSSWGPQLLQETLRSRTDISLSLNAHRSPVAIDRVRSGEYMLALCSGIDTADLEVIPLLEEPMVLVPSRLKPLRLEGPIPVITIETHSETWMCLRRRLKMLEPHWPFSLVVAQTVQSFTCIVQMARAGFGHGLVPLGVAESLGVDRRMLARFPAPGLTRPVSLVARPSTLARPLIQHFLTSLRAALPRFSDL